MLPQSKQGVHLFGEPVTVHLTKKGTGEKYTQQGTVVEVRNNKYKLAIVTRKYTWYCWRRFGQLDEPDAAAKRRQQGNNTGYDFNKPGWAQDLGSEWDDYAFLGSDF